MKIATNVTVDYGFDWKHGTDTIRWVEQSEIDTYSDNRVHSSPYQATKAWPLLRLLRELDLPRDRVFVDIGSGKGRVLLIASQYGFSKVVGIEFSATLCAIARKNIEIFSRTVPLASPVEVVEADATQYSFQPEEGVLFMYNPFTAGILAQVIDNLRNSIARDFRKIWLIYNTPVHHSLITQSGVFTSDAFYEIGGNHFRVYKN